MDAPANSLFSGPVTHLLSMLWVLMKILSQANAKKKTKCLRVSNFVILLVVFKWQYGSEGVNISNFQKSGFRLTAFLYWYYFTGKFVYLWSLKATERDSLSPPSQWVLAISGASYSLSVNGSDHIDRQAPSSVTGSGWPATSNAS